VPHRAIAACLFTLLGLGLALPDKEAPRRDRVLFLGGALSEEQTVCLTSAFAAAEHPGVLLLQSATGGAYLDAFHKAFAPEQVVPVGPCPPETAGEAACYQTLRPEWHTTSHGLRQQLGLGTRRVVVCPAQPRSLLLQGGWLAGVVRAPLYIVHDTPEDTAKLARQLITWHPQRVYAVGKAAAACAELPSLQLVSLPDERAVAGCALRHQLRHGPVRSAVVANPAEEHGGMALLAPWLATQKHAILLLTNPAGDNVRALVEAAAADARLRDLDTVLLVGGPRALPPERRPNPAPGKDVTIDMEPLTPEGSEPFRFAIGRLFHEDTGLVTLLLARQRLLAEGKDAARPRKALVVSNPAGGLPLLETFSRNTASELRNGGYETKALFGHAVTRDEVRRLLPEQDVFLWEGHHSTMTRDYGLPDWPEPLRPSLVFLQSCLALCEAEALPLLRRGAVGVIGTSSRTYSASGGACSLAFFDALLYDNKPLGASLRHAKNFLLAYALLKEKRLGEDAKLRGANLRSAWAFSLWGDPTLTLPRLPVQADALLSVHHEVRGRTIVLHQPRETYEPVRSDRYLAEMQPNARLAGLLRKEPLSDDRSLVPLLFAEIPLPQAPAGRRPQLTSRVPEDHWVFCWDAGRRCGHLLVTPRAHDRGDLRFSITWEEARP
jgi:hypothetical protein